MKLYSKILAIVVPLVVPGCAPYKLEPLAMNHPARPGAIAAPEATPSKTLAYTSADRPSPLPARGEPMTMKMEMMKEGHDSGAVAIGAPQSAVGEGSVVAVVPSSGQIVLDHGDIKGFMGAMTMGYRVESFSVLEGLKQGDQVRFTIDIEKKAIIKVEKLNR